MTDATTHAVEPAAIFGRIAQLFEDSYRLERIAAYSPERVLFVSWDLVLKRHVALRVHLHPNSPAGAWFIREAEVLARLDHEAIRRVYAAGFVDDLAYRTSNWLEGESLAEAVERGAPARPGAR